VAFSRPFRQIVNTDQRNTTSIDIQKHKEDINFSEYCIKTLSSFFNIKLYTDVLYIRKTRSVPTEVPQQGEITEDCSNLQIDSIWTSSACRCKDWWCV